MSLATSLFGWMAVIAGTGMLGRALAARRNLEVWRGEAIIGASMTALGNAFIFGKDDPGIAAVIVYGCAAVGIVAGNVVALRDTRNEQHRAHRSTER